MDLADLETMALGCRDYSRVKYVPHPGLGYIIDGEGRRLPASLSTSLLARSTMCIIMCDTSISYNTRVLYMASTSNTAPLNGGK